MAKVSKVRFAFVKPIMYREVVFGLAAKKLRRPDGMVIGMGHFQSSNIVLPPKTTSAFLSSVTVQAAKSTIAAPRNTNSPAS